MRHADHVHAAEGFPGEAADIVPRILVNQYDAPALVEQFVSRHQTRQPTAGDRDFRVGSILPTHVVSSGDGSR